MTGECGGPMGPYTYIIVVVPNVRLAYITVKKGQDKWTESYRAVHMYWVSVGTMP